MKHFKFPEIEQFRQAIRAVQYNTRCIGKDENGDPIFDGLKPLPTIKYRGTVKLHGSNAAITKDLETGEVSLQSRERMITVDNDNYGFARFMENINLEILFSMVPTHSTLNNQEVDEEGEDKKNYVIIYGEWCGGNIQKGVALCQLEKMFVIFAIRYKGIWLLEQDLKQVKIPEQRIFNILDFPFYMLDIDFQNPEISQNKLGEITQEVEKQCPVGKTFGVEGIGEGCVWVPVDPKWNHSRYWFKVKGDKHSVSKVKKLAAIDVEKVNSINELIDKVVTENRLLQGIEVVKSAKGVSELDRTHIGDFIRWVYNDVIKEETDTIEASGLNTKDLGVPIAKRAKEWLFAEKGI